MLVSSRCLAGVVLLAVLAGCAGPARAPDTEPNRAPDEAPPAARAAGRTWRAALLQAEDTRQTTDSVREGLRSANAERRRLTVRALGRIGDLAMAEALIEAFDDADASVRAEAVFVAAVSGVSGALPAVIAKRNDANNDVRTTVALALGLLAAADGLEPLIELLADDEPDVRIAASYSAARFDKAESLVEPLVELLDDPDHDVARAALFGLSRISARLGAVSFERRTQLRTRLIQLADAKDVLTRALVAEALYRPMAGEQADTLASMLRGSAEVPVVLAIIRSTSFPGAPTFVIHEKTLLHKEQVIVYATILGLARMRGEWVSGVLVDFIIKDDRDWLQAEAIRALGKADGRMALRIANGLSRDPNPMILAATAEALYGRSETAAALYAHRLFESTHPWVRYHAIPAMGGVAEPLTEVFAEIFETGPLEMKAQMARAAGYRLTMVGRTDEIYRDALQLLDDLWKVATRAKALALQIAVLDAAAEGAHAKGRMLIRRGLQADEFAVRRHAASLLRSRFEEEVEIEPPPTRPLAHYERIVDWALRKHAAVIQVYRPGFEPGWFTIALDSRRAPMTAWRFAQLAQQGYYDQRRIGSFVPGLRVHSGSGGDNRYAGTSGRAEPILSTFPPGTVAAVAADPDALLGEWMVTMARRPNYLGRFLPFGRVVQNLPGVVGNILPIDQVVSVKLYEGTGSEPIPPQASR